MSIPVAHQPFDFENMPPTNEQKILATLERIEVLLTPKPQPALAGPHADLRVTTEKAPPKAKTANKYS